MKDFKSLPKMNTGGSVKSVVKTGSGSVNLREQPVNLIIPKLFTEPRGEEVVQNNLWKFTPARAWWGCSLIEQSWCGGLK